MTQGKLLKDLHPWVSIALNRDGNVFVSWCPHCGALLYKDGEILFPSMAQTEEERVRNKT